jgi:hypothetical protein
MHAPANRTNLAQFTVVTQYSWKQVADHWWCTTHRLWTYLATDAQYVPLVLSGRLPTAQCRSDEQHPLAPVRHAPQPMASRHAPTATNQCRALTIWLMRCSQLSYAGNYCICKTGFNVQISAFYPKWYSCDFHNQQRFSFVRPLTDWFL